MGVVQMGVVQTGVVQMGVVQMGVGWDGIDCWYWCRHRSKDCKKAHHLPSQASTFWVGRVIPMNNLHHGHVCTDEFTQTGATITYYNIQVLQRR